MFILSMIKIRTHCLMLISHLCHSCVAMTIKQVSNQILYIPSFPFISTSEKVIHVTGMSEEGLEKQLALTEIEVTSRVIYR